MPDTNNPQAETAHALLWRHGVPEDVIDGALCLHAQELAAQQRAHAEAEDGEPGCWHDGAHRVADLIDPTKAAAATVPASTPTEQVREVLAFAERIIATSGPGAASAVQAVVDRLLAALDVVPVSGPGGAADETQAECACDPAPHREEDGTYSHWAGCPVADAQQAADAEPVPPVDRCIHVKAIHDTHHHTPVTGCPWCAAATGTEA